MVTMELVGTIGGDGFLNITYFYQCPKCKMLEIYSHPRSIPNPHECVRCKRKTDKCIVCGIEQEISEYLNWVTYSYGKRIPICSECMRNKSRREIDDAIENNK